MSESTRCDDDTVFIDCNEADHAGAILDILNDTIVNSTALYDYVPRPPGAMSRWFDVKRPNGFPVIGAVDSAGTLMGFASWGTFRAFPAYKYHRRAQRVCASRVSRPGFGRTPHAQDRRTRTQAQVHVLVGCIDATNVASIDLHTKLGFTHSSTVTQAGFKFGRWLDAAFYQLTLKTPAHPIDG